MRTTTKESGPSGPMVTIGLPVHNGEDFIDEAITSIRSQTYSDFELLVGDNASTDSTMSIVLRHASEDPRIRVLSVESNRGAAWNFNRLVGEARGRFFKWAAHDDVLAPRSLEVCVAVLATDPSVVLCYGKAVDIDERGAVVGAVVSVDYAAAADPIDRALGFLRADSSCVEVFGLVRKDALERTKLIGAYTSSDRTLLFELALLGRFCELDEVLIRRRQHRGRSVVATARDRNAWFDPERGDVFTFPRWRLIKELQSALGRAPVEPVAKARARITVARWGLVRADLLMREVLAWVRWRPANFVRRLFSRTRTTDFMEAS